MSLTNKEVIGVINECQDLGVFSEQAKIVLQNLEHYKLAEKLKRYCELHKKKNQGAEYLTNDEKHEKAILKKVVFSGLESIVVK